MRVLMCRPDYYTVDYEINPWMHVREKPDQALATVQWQALHDTFTGLGIDVELIEPVKGLPDMVFTANGGLVSGNRFILSLFRHEERQGEAAYFEAWANRSGFETVRLSGDFFFEGEGDVLRLPFVTSSVGETLVAGYRYRSEIRSHNQISELLGVRVVSIELASEHFYHLDTCFCPLNEKAALYYPGAFDDYGKKVLSNIFESLIAIGEQDAKSFCANAVVRGKDVVMNPCSAALKEQLKALGFNTHEVELSEFIKAGGSAKCLVLKLD